MKYLIENYGIYEEPNDMVDILDRENVVEVEERAVYIDADNNCAISVDGDGQKDRGFLNDPYFKFHRSKSIRKGETIRVSFSDEPRYVVHNNQDSTLTSKERKYLNDIMDKKSNVKEYKDLTVWEAIKQAAKDESSTATKEQINKIDSLDCPDFKNIKPAK